MKMPSQLGVCRMLIRSLLLTSHLADRSGLHQSNSEDRLTGARARVLSTCDYRRILRRRQTASLGLVRGTMPTRSCALSCSTSGQYSPSSAALWRFGKRGSGLELEWGAGCKAKSPSGAKWTLRVSSACDRYRLRRRGLRHNPGRRLLRLLLWFPACPGFHSAQPCTGGEVDVRVLPEDYANYRSRVKARVPWVL
jgi:hypothetical protein